MPSTNRGKAKTPFLNKNIRMTGTIVPLLYTILFVVAVHWSRFFILEKIPRKFLTGAFLLKVLVGFVFYLVYTRYYVDQSVSDALRYFNDAQVIYHEWSQHRDIFWALMFGNELNSAEYIHVTDQLHAWSSGYTYGLSDDCSTIIRINVILSFVTFGSFHAHAIILSFLSFVGFVALYKAFVRFFFGKEWWLFVICFLLPSVVFWSSSVLKESPLFLFLGFMLWHIMMLISDRRRWKSWLMVLVCFALLFYLKMYVIVSMLPALIFLLIALMFRKVKLIYLFIIVHVLCFIVAQNAHHFFSGGDFLYVLHKRQTDFYNVAYLTKAGSVIDIPPIGTASQFLLHYPQAFFLTYFRPLPFEVSSLPGFFFGFENLLYLMFFCVTLFSFKRKISKEEGLLVFFMISFLLVFASILGNCVPILGAVLRYKVVALPFLLIVLAMLIDRERLPSMIRRFV